MAHAAPVCLYRIGITRRSPCDFSQLTKTNVSTKYDILSDSQTDRRDAAVPILGFVTRDEKLVSRQVRPEVACVGCRFQHSAVTLDPSLHGVIAGSQHEMIGP